MSWPAMTGDPLGGAFEWNLARTMRVMGGVGPRSLSPLLARVLAALQGAWVAGGDEGCQTLKGKHQLDCSHRLNLVPVRVGILAEMLFGQSGGSQRRQVRRAVADLVALDVDYRPYRPGEFGRFRGPLISLVPSTDQLRGRLTDEGVPGSPDLVIRFADDLIDGLTKGQYQRVPVELVQGLSGEGFLVWLAVLCRAASGRPTKGGRPMSIYFTGRRPTVERWAVGMQSLQGQRLEAAITRAADRGNGVQDEFIMTLDHRPPPRGGVRPLLAVQLMRAYMPPTQAAPEPGGLGSPARPERQSNPNSVPSKDVNTVGLDRATPLETYGSTVRAIAGGVTVVACASLSVRGRPANISWTPRFRMPWHRWAAV